MTVPGEHEIALKLVRMRHWLEQCGAGALRLRGADWFAWASAGASNMVSQNVESGVAEIMVTPDAAYVLTDEIDAARLKQEELPGNWTWQVVPWAQHELRDHFVFNAAGDKPVLSDRPAVHEQALPICTREERLALLPSEQDRYRQVGRLAAAAISEAMRRAQPDWTEYELAGAGAHALWSRGLQPVQVLAAGEDRLQRYRHPLPTIKPLGRHAMLVLCARRFGLYVSLSRFLRFGPASHQSAQDEARIMAIEAVALDACEAGQPLCMAYHALDSAYAYAGQPDAIREQHQGGITGYLAREMLATAHSGIHLKSGMALVLSPSLAGIKVEDTFLLQGDQLENLSFDPAWPSTLVQGRQRPVCLQLV